jgi:hypothetical protein
MNELPKCNLVTMTKERVESMIAMNSSNRNLRQRVVDAYARDMISGNSFASFCNQYQRSIWWK